MQAGSFLTLLFANPGQFNVQDDPNRFPCCCFHICNFYHQPKKILLYIFESSIVLFTMMMRWFLRSSTINFVRFHSFQQLLTRTRANGRKDPSLWRSVLRTSFSFLTRPGHSLQPQSWQILSGQEWRKLLFKGELSFPTLSPMDKHR